MILITIKLISYGELSRIKTSDCGCYKNNGNQEITGAILQNVLKSIVSVIGENATFAGIATPETNPGTPDQNIFYIASSNGVYSNFDGYKLEDEIVLFVNKSQSWKHVLCNIYNKDKVKKKCGK